MFGSMGRVTEGQQRFAVSFFGSTVDHGPTIGALKWDTFSLYDSYQNTRQGPRAVNGHVRKI